MARIVWSLAFLYKLCVTHCSTARKITWLEHTRRKFGFFSERGHSILNECHNATVASNFVFVNDFAFHLWNLCKLIFVFYAESKWGILLFYFLKSQKNFKINLKVSQRDSVGFFFIQNLCVNSARWTPTRKKLLQWLCGQARPKGKVAREIEACANSWSKIIVIIIVLCLYFEVQTLELFRWRTSVRRSALCVCAFVFRFTIVVCSLLKSDDDDAQRTDLLFLF